MSNLSGFLKQLFNFRQKKLNSNLEQRVSWLLQPYLSIVHDIITWRNPRVTICSIIIVHFFVWVFRISNIRPIGLISIILLLLVLLDATATFLTSRKHYFRQYNRNNGEQLLLVSSRARQWFSDASTGMMQLRYENPSKFCIFICIAMGSVWFILYIGGAILIHTIATLVFLLPMASNLQKKIVSIHSTPDSDGEVDEFLPELSTCAIEELQRADEPQEVNELPSLASVDLPLSLDSNILNTAAEGESSDDEDEFINPIQQMGKSNATTPSLPSTDSDSDNDFIPTNLQKPMFDMENILDSDSKIVLTTTKEIPAVASSELKIKEAHVSENWIPYLVHAASSYLKSSWSSTPTAKKHVESDSDDFELIEESDL